jgi:uncharacterized membrane protein
MKNNQKQQNTKRNKKNLNDLISTGFMVCTLLSLTMIIAGFILLFFSDIENVQLSIHLDQIAAAITLNLGILVLISTPMIQVILASVKFSLERDKVFAGISLLVLALLSICFIIALV